MNLFVVTRANTFRNSDQRATVDVSVLRLVAHTKNAHAAAEVMELSFTPLGERVLNCLSLTVAQFPTANDLVDGLLDQTLQIAGSQVE